MTTEDINQITAAVIAQLRQGATDLDGIKASSALADTDNVIAANGSTVKKLPVSLFKKIMASTVYRLMVSGQTFKADTTAVLVGVTKSEGGKIEQLTALPKGWRIKVEWKGSASAMSNVLSAPGTINPNAATGSTSVEITLYNGDPTTDQTAQAIDEATLLLVSDGKDGSGGEEVLYDECFYPNKAATTDTDRYTDSTEILQPTGYVGDYTDADGKQWTDVFSCESFPDWFDAVQHICYPYDNGLSVGIPFIKHTWTVTDGKLVFNFNKMVDATVPYFNVAKLYGLKKIDDTHFTVYNGKGGEALPNWFDKTKIDCAKFAFGNATLNTLYDVTGCKRIRVRLMGGVNTPSKYASLVPETSPFAMRNYIRVQTLYADNYVEYELGESSYALTRHGSSSFYRTSYTQSPQLLSGEFNVNIGTSVYSNHQAAFVLYKTGGKTYFCLNGVFNPAAQITMGSRIIIEKLE